MSITPQMIKDQEFEVKFRGFDPIEVRDYLEVVANEFFEMQEMYKEQLEELDGLRDGKEGVEDHSKSLEADMEFNKMISEELKESCSQKDGTIEELKKEIEELQLRIADIEQEKVEGEEEVSAAEARIGEVEFSMLEMEEEKEALERKVALLQDKNDDLQKEEVDFKSTLASAQRFAEDLKERSKVEAEEMIAAVHTEINSIRDNAQEELERLPKEIEVLRGKKGKVKDELKGILETYLETLDVFYPEGEESQENAADKDDEGEEDLFQKVEIGEDGMISQEDLEKIQSGEGAALLQGSDDEEPLASLFGQESDSDEGGEGEDVDNLYKALDLDDPESSEEEVKKESF